RDLSFSAISVVTPARLPLSTSAFLSHSLRVCAEQPILPETDTTAAQRDEYSPPCSCTIRTARARTSFENLFVVLLVMLHPTQELEPPVFARSAIVELRAASREPPGSLIKPVCRQGSRPFLRIHP